MAENGAHRTFLQVLLPPNQLGFVMPPLRQLGGLSRKMRMRYTARRKLGLLAPAVRIMEEEGVTLRRAAE